MLNSRFFKSQQLIMDSLIRGAVFRSNVSTYEHAVKVHKNLYDDNDDSLSSFIFGTCECNVFGSNKGVSVLLLAK